MAVRRGGRNSVQYLLISDPVVTCVWHESVNVFRFIFQLIEHSCKVRLYATMAMNVTNRM